jgi:hypothetical protein
MHVRARRSTPAVCSGMDDPKDMLRAHVGARRKVQVERSRPSNPRLNGFVLASSETLCYMHVFHDFYPDGYVVVRLDDVESVRSGPYERFWDEMLSGKGLLGGLERPPPVDLSSMEAAIASIDRACGRMIIQCEDDEEDVEDFYIGVVAQQGDGAVLFHHFDGLGRWESPGAVIEYAEVTMIQIETPYMQQFWSHVQGPPPG